MKSDFSVAVHALVYLSVKGCTLSSDALADNICTNAARVRKVMARLKKAGLVGAREGSEGGFCPRFPPPSSRWTGWRPPWTPPLWSPAGTAAPPTATAPSVPAWPA